MNRHLEGLRRCHQAGFSASHGVKSPAAAVTSGAQGLDPDIIAEIERMYGFDKTAHANVFWLMIRVTRPSLWRQLLRDAMCDRSDSGEDAGLYSPPLFAGPVDERCSTYLILHSPLGIRKGCAPRPSTFDIWNSSLIIVGYAIPGFSAGHSADRGIRRRQVTLTWFPAAC